MAKEPGFPGRIPPNIVQDEPCQKPSGLLDLSNFDINAVLRGMQLTLVGGANHFVQLSRLLFRSNSTANRVASAHRALQNPAMFTSDHYKQAAYAVVIGIAIRLIVSVPV